MNVLFLDQSGKLGGAELFLADIARTYQQSCLIGLFEDGLFRQLLEQQNIAVEILNDRAIAVRKNSNLLQSLGSVGQLIPLIARVVQLSRRYDLIYANTQKALVVGAIASYFSHRPFVYHLHDILSADHFSATNRRLIVGLANRFASLVIANSRASQSAFIEAGGRKDIVSIVYNGFEPQHYQVAGSRSDYRKKLGLNDRFVVGHFSRLSPWKGQHILLEALTHCPDNVVALFVGDALFGEQEYVRQVHQQVAALGLEHRVQFLGFRSDVPQLMAACDLVAHTSTAPEPFGRVIVEGMLCGRPVVAAAAGGAIELIEHCKTGWLASPGDAQALADTICTCLHHPTQSAAIAHQAQMEAIQRFHIDTIRQQINCLLQQKIHVKGEKS